MKLISSTDSIGEYYVVEIDEPYPYDETWGTSWFPDIDVWCTNTFGPSDLWGEPPRNGWKCMRNKYYFTSEGIQDLFVLKWQ